jgi:hypothetical protein
MRTSNKILLSVFLAAVLVLAGIHIALYAKLKRGDFISAKEMWKLDYTRHELSMVRYVVATGMDNITIIPSDSAWLEIQKNGSSRIRFQVIGDSLILHGDTTVISTDGSSVMQKSWSGVNIYLPSFSKIRGDNAEFKLQGSADSTKAPSLDIIIDHAGKIRLAENEWNDSSNRYFKNISVLADHSSGIELASHTQIDEMNLILMTSSFDDKEAVINRISIQSDPKSSVALTGANLQKLSLRKEP